MAYERRKQRRNKRRRVPGYTKKDGTKVKGYWRKKNKTKRTYRTINRGKTVHVDGHYRKIGGKRVWVGSYRRSKPKK